MTIDLSNYSTPELDELIRSAEKQKRKNKQHDKAEAKKELKKIADKYGLSVEELANNGGATKDKGSAAQFRDPATGKTWSGRGRKPEWVKEAEQAGRSLDEFRVSN